MTWAGYSENDVGGLVDGMPKVADKGRRIRPRARPVEPREPVKSWAGYEIPNTFIGPDGRPSKPKYRSGNICAAQNNNGDVISKYFLNSSDPIMTTRLPA